MIVAFIVNSKNRLTDIKEDQMVEIFDIKNGLAIPIRSVVFADYENLFEILLLNKCHLVVLSSVDVGIYKELQHFNIEMKHYGNITLTNALMVVKESTVYNPLKDEQQYVQSYELGNDLDSFFYTDDDDIGGS